MANTKSAKKAVRQATRRTVVNKTRRTRLRSSVRKVEEAISLRQQGGRRCGLERGAAGDRAHGTEGYRPPQFGITKNVASGQARGRDGKALNKKTSPVASWQQTARRRAALACQFNEYFNRLLLRAKRARRNAPNSRQVRKKNSCRVAFDKFGLRPPEARVPSLNPAFETGTCEAGQGSRRRGANTRDTPARRLISGLGMCIVQPSERGIPLLHN